MDGQFGTEVEDVHTNSYVLNVFCRSTVKDKAAMRTIRLYFRQDRPCTYDVIFRRVRATIVAVVK
jgi:hypothetical protein